MSTIPVKETSLKYYLISFDKDGNERPEHDSGEPTSQEVLKTLSQEEITDIFLISHGWRGDIPAAKNQYQRWIKAMADNPADIQKMNELRTGFNPLIIGIHWPSKPFGNEKLDAVSPASTDDNAQLTEAETQDLIEQYTAEVSNTPATREALQTILQAEQPSQDAYQTLLREAYSDGESNPDPAWNEGEVLVLGEPSESGETTSESGETDIDFGIGGFALPSIRSSVFLIPELASYWQMKNRARDIGQTSGFDLLKKLQSATTEQVRFHLIGHSFGTILVSSMLRGPSADSSLVRPINSLSLLQGAVSLWAFCSEIPYKKSLMGYFHPIISNDKVAGPIVITHSKHDGAVGKMYPIASNVGRLKGGDLDFDVGSGGTKFPKLGGIGRYGIQGPGVTIRDTLMKDTAKAYKFKPGVVYNLNADAYVDDHSDINNPEVAHAVWSAAFER